MDKKPYHSICAWTYNAGKGGFTPSATRPNWSDEKLDTVGKIKLIKEKIKPALPDHIELGLEFHYDYEYNEKNASAIADALVGAGISLAMVTPGAHRYFPYGGELYTAIEPKPNEGYPAMFLPTVASAIVFWRKLEQEYNINLEKKGVNKEFGHSEMIGLDHVYDTVEEIDDNMLTHMHIKSQGYNDGLILGGPGKYDIDNGARINGMNIAIAGLLEQSGYSRWKGHDMQVRAHGTEEQGIDRIIRSILSRDACEKAARETDYNLLSQYLEKRQTAKAEDLMRNAVMNAYYFFDEQYKSR